MKHPLITMNISDFGRIVFELYPEIAPNSVNSLLDIFMQKAFDGMKIQRLVPGFVFQPWYDEAQMDDRFQDSIDGEFTANGFQKRFSLDAYTVGMAGDGAKTSGSSCFFITVAQAHHLNSSFAGVGKVIEGFDVLDQIMNVEMNQVIIDAENVQVFEPVKPIYIETVQLDLKGYVPEKPVLLPRR